MFPPTNTCGVDLDSAAQMDGRHELNSPHFNLCQILVYVNMTRV